MTGWVDVAFGHAGRFDLSEAAQSLQSLTLLVVMLEGASPAPMQGGVVGDVCCCKMEVDVFFEGSHAEAALYEMVLIGGQWAAKKLGDGVTQCGRLDQQGMETLDGAEGAIFASDDHHLRVQVVLDFKGLE